MKYLSPVFTLHSLFDEDKTYNYGLVGDNHNFAGNYGNQKGWKALSDSVLTLITPIKQPSSYNLIIGENETDKLD